MPDLLGDYAAGQRKHSENLQTNVWDQYTGDVNPVVDQSVTATRHKSGYPTNATASPEEKSVMYMAAGVVIIAALFLVFSGAVAFRGFNF